MLTVLVEEAREGMTLAAPVTHPDRPDQPLLKHGYVLEQKILGRLVEMGITCIYVDYPGLEDLDRHLGPMLSPERQVVYNQIRQTISACQGRTKANVAYTDYYASTRELVLTLMSQGQHPLFLDQMARMGGDAVGHATAVAHLALLLGIKLEHYLILQRKRLEPRHAKEVVNIGVAGMLHDIGKVKLPPELQQYNGMFLPEDARQQAEWAEHARLGYEMIHDGVEPSAASAILCHHRRFDGRGFDFDGKTEDERPRSGEYLHVFARILFAANLFDRLSTQTGDNARRPNIEIFHLLRTTHAGWIDPVILKMLETIAPPFPPGMMVELSDRSKAVVSRSDPADPYRPVVRRFQEDGVTLEESSVELRSQSGLRIHSIGGRKVEGLLPAA